LAVLAVVWKQVKLLTFDADFAASVGLATRTVDVVVTALLVVAIVIGLQTVGVVLMSALLVAPAAAARQWTDRLGVMTMLAGGFGAVSGAVGAAISAEVKRTPTGPAIVLVATLLVVVSLAFAPRRGLVPAAFRARVARRRVAGREVLQALYTLELSHDGSDRSHAAPVVSAMTGVDTAAALRELERRGSVRRHGDLWALTDTGREEVNGR
jgi:manganese/zinc/iron transport system permease protein